MKLKSKHLVALVMVLTMVLSLVIGVFPAVTVFAVEMNTNEEHNATVQTFVITPDAELVMEAEAGKHYWPADPNWTVGPYGGVSSNGTDFVAGFYSNPGSYVEYPISVQQAGKYTLKVCYVNGGAGYPEFGIYLDGALVDKHGYAPTGDWGTWGYYEIQVELTTEAKSLTFVAEPGITDAINLDYISVKAVPAVQMNTNEAHNATVPTTVIGGQNEIIMEAEAGKHYWPADPNWIVGPYGGVSSNGTDFVAGFYSNPGSYVEYPISVQQAGKYILKVCYVNGGAGYPEFGIYVNDQLVDKHGYAPTGDWGTWGYYEIEIELTAEATTLKFVAEPGITDAINLDYIAVKAVPSVQMNTNEEHNATVTTTVIGGKNEIILEAESGKHYWPADPNWTVGPYPGGVGSNGSGFVAGFTRNPGSYVEFPISVEKAGKYILKVCYANGGIVSPEFGIYVNDQLLDKHAYAPVGGWGDWGFYEIEIELTTDATTLKFVAEPGMGEAINLDYLSVKAAPIQMNTNEEHNANVPTITIKQEADTILEAEAGKHYWPADPNWTVGPYPGGVGSNGSGFVAGFTRNPGSYVEFPIVVEKAGKYTLKVCYANGGVVSPEFGIYINDQLVDKHAYAPVGGWGDWGFYEIEIELTTDATSLKFVAEPDMGEAINLDYILVVPEKVLDTSAINAAIDAANAAKTGLEIIDNKTAAEVAYGTQFVTSAELKALNDAIAAAEAAKATAQTEEDVTNAVNALEAATATFKSAIKTGTLIVMNTDETHNANVPTVTIKPDAMVTLEAEAGKHYWPSHPNWTVGPYPGGVGSNGTGFVAGFYSNPGSYVAFPVVVEKAGVYKVKVCYANGGGASPEFGIYANDQLLDKHAYAPVGDWSAWGYYEVEVELLAGENILKFVAEPGITDAINLDYISLTYVPQTNPETGDNMALPLVAALMLTSGAALVLLKKKEA